MRRPNASNVEYFGDGADQALLELEHDGLYQSRDMLQQQQQQQQRQQQQQLQEQAEQQQQEAQQQHRLFQRDQTHAQPPGASFHVAVRDSAPLAHGSASSATEEAPFSALARLGVIFAALLASAVYMLVIKGSQRADGTYAYSSVPVVLLAGNFVSFTL